MCFELAANAGLIERLYPKTEVIEIPRFFPRCRTAGFAEFAIDWDEINQRPAGTQLNQTYLVLAPLYRAPENTAVETKHAFEVDNAQDKMVDFANMDHASLKQVAMKNIGER